MKYLHLLQYCLKSPVSEPAKIVHEPSSQVPVLIPAVASVPALIIPSLVKFLDLLLAFLFHTNMLVNQGLARWVLLPPVADKPKQGFQTHHKEDASMLLPSASQPDVLEPPNSEMNVLVAFALL